jgi:DNA-binding MarR family transcriptional regulator
VTSLLDRLEQRGFLKRTADPKDRRKVIASVELKRLHDRGNIYESIGETFDKLAQTYSTKELEFLVEYYRRSIELTKQEIAKLRPKS